MGVPVSSYNFSSDHYNPYSNLWRPAVAAPLMSAQQHNVPSTTVFSAVDCSSECTIVPPNKFVPYTSGETVFFVQPENFSDANQPFVPDYHGLTRHQLPLIHPVQTSSVHFRHESWLVLSCTAEKIISLSGS